MRGTSLAARFDTPATVAARTTLGMMLADVPAVFLCDVVARRGPLRIMRGVAAIIFVALGVLTLLDVAHLF